VAVLFGDWKGFRSQKLCIDNSSHGSFGKRPINRRRPMSAFDAPIHFKLGPNIGLVLYTVGLIARPINMSSSTPCVRWTGGSL